MGKGFVIPSVLAGAGMTFFIAAAGGRGEAAKNETREFQQAVNVTRTYLETCAKCHGENGEGGGGGTKTLLTEDKFDQKWDKPFFDAIKNGVPDMGMESYGETWSDAEVWAQVVHIRELQARALRAKNGGPKAVDGIYSSQHHKYKVEPVYEGGMSTPWSLDWLPDGRMLVTNRNGSLFVIRDGKKESEVQNLPKSIEQGQGGLMEVAVHPDYAKNGWIYLSVADPAADGNGAMTRIVRGKIDFKGDAPRFTNEETIYQAPADTYSRAGIHFGGKIAFDGKGHIFFSVGERGTNMGAQGKSTPYGKIMRLMEDGKVPGDNPVSGSPMWTYGHRNPQGLTIDLDGNVWDTEHGPRGGDEINLIKKGLNYGWPIATYSINYNDTPHSSPWPTDGTKVEHPVSRWLPSVGASGLDVMRGSAFPNWKGDLIAGGLAGNNLDRYRMKDGKLVEREELLYGMGRIRDIAVAKDGTIYVVVNGPDKIVRVVPAGQ